VDGAPERKTAESNYADGPDEGWPLFAWRSFLYFSSAPSSTGVVEGRISEEPSGASETQNVIYVAHSRHPAAPFLPIAAALCQ